MNIFKMTLKRLFASKVRMAILILGPMIFIILFGLVSNYFLMIGIVDNDKTDISRGLIEQLSNIFNVRVIEESDIIEKNTGYIVEYSLIIDKGFTEELVNGIRPVVREYFIGDKDSIQMGRIVVNNLLNNLYILAKEASINGRDFYKLHSDYMNQGLNIQLPVTDIIEKQYTANSLGFLLQFLIAMSIITTGTMLEDRESGTFYRIFYAPVSVSRYLTESILAYMSVGLVQILSITLLLKYGFSLNFSGNFFLSFLLLTIFSLVCISLGIFVISIFKKAVYAYNSVGLISVLFIMLGGGYWPRNFLPEILKKISLFIPTTWVMEGINTVIIKNGTIVDISLEIMILILFSILFFSAGLFKNVDIAEMNKK